MNKKQWVFSILMALFVIGVPAVFTQVMTMQWPYYFGFSVFVGISMEFIVEVLVSLGIICWLYDRLK